MVFSDFIINRQYYLLKMNNSSRHTDPDDEEEIKESHEPKPKYHEDDLIYKYDENADYAEGARGKAESTIYDVYMRGD